MLSGAKAGASLVRGPHFIALGQQGALRGGPKALAEVRLGIGKESLRVLELEGCGTHCGRRGFGCGQTATLGHSQCKINVSITITWGPWLDDGQAG